MFTLPAVIAVVFFFCHFCTELVEYGSNDNEQEQNRCIIYAILDFAMVVGQIAIIYHLNR